MNKAFRSGFAHLATFGLTFEAWCYHTQLYEVIHLARQFPETLIVLDHFGGPLGVGPYNDQAAAVFLEWDRAMTELAACDNVVTKLGGLAMEVNGFNWHRLPAPPTSDDLLKGCAHYYERTIELFGVDRCLFESNFPVDKLIDSAYNQGIRIGPVKTDKTNSLLLLAFTEQRSKEDVDKLIKFLSTYTS